MPRILVVRDDGQVEEEFPNPPLRSPEWPGLALAIQKAVRRARQEGAGEGKVLVPMVDFIGPAVTLLTRAEATAALTQELGSILMITVNNFNSILDTPVENWGRDELYQTIEDWKKDLVIVLAQITRSFNEEVDSGGGNTDSPI